MGIGVIAIQKGNFTLGRRQLDKDGNVVKETPPRWEHDPAGACVAIVPLKPDTMAADKAAGAEPTTTEKAGTICRE